jgi:predicted enzyme related to lactoylglutathione lyase
VSDDPNPEGRVQASLGIDRSHRSEQEYARSTGARSRSSFDAGELEPTRRKLVTHGNFAWHELYTRDVKASKAFYAATVGWTFEGMPMPNQNRTYWIAKAGDNPVAGVLDMRGIVPDADPPHWLSYLEVDDVDRLVAEVQSHGGRVVRQPFDVPEFGRIAIGADRTGAFMAWVTLKH